jgi:hypothetical protein
MSQNSFQIYPFFLSAFFATDTSTRGAKQPQSAQVSRMGTDFLKEFKTFVLLSVLCGELRNHLIKQNKIA